MNPPGAPKKEKKKLHNKRKVLRPERLKEEQERRKQARVAECSATSPSVASAAAVVTQPSQSSDLSPSPTPVESPTVAVASQSSKSSSSQKKKAKLSAIQKQSNAKATNDGIKVTQENWLHWLRELGPPPSSTTVSASSLKKTACHLFQPIKLAKNKSPTSSAGRIVRTPVVSDSPSNVATPAVAAPLELDALSEPLRRLLLEDIISWLPDLTKALVLCFNYTSPHYFRLKQLYDASESPLPVIAFGPVAFFQLCVVVEKNPKAKAMLAGTHNRKDFLHLLTGNGNEQLSFLSCDCPDGVSASFTLLWNDFFQHKLSLLLFARTPYQRKFRLAFNKLGNDSNLLLFRQLADEVRYDVATTYDLCASYEASIKDSNLPIVKSPSASKVTIVEGLVGKSLDAFEKEVDAVILAEVLLCYGSFVSWTDSILSDALVDHLVLRAYDVVPNMMLSITEFLGTRSKMNLSTKQHLVVKYRRTGLFQLMAMARLCFNQRFVWWAIINTAIYYHTSSKELVSNLTKLFGITCAFNTLRTKLLGFTEPSSYRKRVVASLEQERVVVCVAAEDDDVPYVTEYWFLILVFDNTQKNFRLKWQRGGRSSHFLKLTSRMFWKLHQGPWRQVVLPANAKVPLVYVDQLIPSALFMPAWELFQTSDCLFQLLVHPQHLKVPQGLPPPPLVDLSGERVAKHSHLVYYANTCRCMYRHLSLLGRKEYAFRPTLLSASRSLAQAAGHLVKCRGFGSILREASSFQRRVADIYRPGRPKIRLLCLPVMKFDETTRLGMANVVVQLLKDSMLLVESGAVDPEMAVWVVPSDYESRYVLIAGDGLSHERWRAYEKELLELQENGVSYVKHFRQCTEIIKALERCILVPGDLHASLFHTLGPVYTVFYGGFMQPFQIALGFKHIDWKKVEKNYRQTSILAIELLTRVEARLIETFVSSLSLEEIISNTGEGDEGTALVTFIAMSFELWISKKIHNTTDDWFRLVLNFFVQCRDYRTSRESIRNGDTVMLEALHQRFMYIFCAVRKPKCFENAVHTIETFYHDIPYWALQVIRDNRTGRLYDGVEVQSGRHTTDRALDETMEIVQHKYKSMDFPGNEDAFELHSYNMPLAQRCAMFAQHQYTTRYNVESVDEYNAGTSVGDSNVEDKGNRKKKGVMSKRTEEKMLIDEIITLSKVCEEMPGRKLNPNLIWDVLPHTTVVLTPKKKGSKKTSETNTQETETERQENEEEQNVSRIVPEMEELRRLVREVESSGPRGSNEGDDAAEEVNIDLSTGLIDEEADVVDADVDETGIAEGAQVQTETETVVEEVTVGKSNRKVKKIQVNPLALKDLHKEGREKMVKLELPRRRLRRQERKKREQKAYHQNLFDFLEGMKGGAEAEIEKLKEGGRSTERRLRYELSRKLMNG